MDEGNERLRDEMVDSMRHMHRLGAITTSQLNEFETECANTTAAVNSPLVAGSSAADSLFCSAMPTSAARTTKESSDETYEKQTPCD